MKKSKGKINYFLIIRRFLTAILLLIFIFLQFLFYFELIFGMFENINIPVFRYAYFLVYGFGIIEILRLYNKDVNISYKLTWTILILLFPFFGVFIYMFYGNGKSLPKKKANYIRKVLTTSLTYNDQKEILKERDKNTYKLLYGLQNTTGFPSFNDSKVIFFEDTILKFESVLNDINNAKKYIFLEFFIVSDGKLLDRLIDLLEKKANEGVKIYFLYDDVGSKTSLRIPTIKKIKSINNIEMHAFSPFGKLFNPSVNYRDHRKIIVIDGVIAYTGGDNLADEYIHEKERFGYWRDNSIKVEGNACSNFVILFLEIWFLASKQLLDPKEFIVENENKNNNNSFLLPFGDGPTYKNYPTYSLFLNMITSANEKIYISTPYFIIDKSFINALVRAIKSGIEVCILVPHIPDKKAVFYITRGHYGEILRAGGKIYEYSKGFTHSKNIFVDSKYAYVGTSNFDYRSMFLHFECGAFICLDSSINEMEKDFIDTINESKEIKYEEWKKRPWYQKIIEQALAFFSPLF